VIVPVNYYLEEDDQKLWFQGDVLPRI